MRGKAIRLSPNRRFICDLLHAAASVPSVPVQRRMRLPRVVEARAALADRPSWTAIFTKAYANVTVVVPELRRAYVKLPWPHLYEYPVSVATIAVLREYGGENCVLFGRIKDPAGRSLRDLNRMIRDFQQVPVEECKDFRKALRMNRLPRSIRRCLWWLGLNIARQRVNRFGTFGISVYSGLGAESLHPLSPLTTTLNYGVIDPDGSVDVRLIYDHRVMDGSTVARALALLESELNGSLIEELRSAPSSRNPEPATVHPPGIAA